jgi:hypothetical protein
MNKNYVVCAALLLCGRLMAMERVVENFKNAVFEVRNNIGYHIDVSTSHPLVQGDKERCTHGQLFLYKLSEGLGCSDGKVTLDLRPVEELVQEPLKEDNFRLKQELVKQSQHTKNLSWIACHPKTAVAAAAAIGSAATVVALRYLPALQKVVSKK